MAIDKNKTKELVGQINELFDTVCENLPTGVRDFLKKSVMGPALEEIRKLIDDARPPRLFLIGRCGHGKSSLLNALANKTVADTSDVKPCTYETIPYEITFEDRYATWSVYDTRGIFETTRPQKASSEDPVSKLEADIFKFKPDVIMHVISAPEIRNLSNDLEVFKNLMEKIKCATGTTIPTIVVLNKADTLGNPRDWPPEERPKKAGMIKDGLDYVANDVLHVKAHKNIDANYPIKGYTLSDDTYVGLIPVCCIDKEEDRWNIETLSWFIGEHLPREAILDFFQGQQRRKLLKQVSTSLIKRLSVIASGIGASPIPIADIFILTPLQILMIAIIGGLSCRPFSKETACEYITACGINFGFARGLRTLAQQLVKLIPIPIIAQGVSGAIAGSGTYAIGKAAEAYFFSGEIRKPDDFKDEWTNPEGD
jgi:uncharacterized protein (DUF697 family)/predicted GTPase